MQTFTNLLVNGIQSVTAGGSGITRKFFPGLAKNFTSGSGAPTVGTINPFNTLAHNNQLLHVIAAGNVTVDSTIACPTVKLELMANATVANPTSASSGWTAICAPSAHTPGSDAQSGEAGSTQPWFMEAYLQADNVSGYLHGSYRLVIDNTNYPASNGWAVLDANLTGINMNTGISQGQPPFYLAMAITFGTTGAANSGSMFQFALEA